jgi:hypothetical protein
MEFLRDLTTLRKKVEALSDNFSGKKYSSWMIGITSDPKNIEKKNSTAHVVECELESYAQMISEQFEREGVRKDPDSSAGRFVYVYPAKHEASA